MENYRHIEKATLNIIYTLELPTDYFNERYNFDDFSLDVSLLKIDCLKDLKIINSSSEKYGQIIIRGIVEISIRKESKTYKSMFWIR